MSAMLPIVLAILLVVAFGFLVRALAWAMRQEDQSLADDAEIRALRIEKTRAVESLRDLEFDLQLKKISQEDYDAMRGPAQRRAIDAIRALDDASRKLGAIALAVVLSVMAFSSPAEAFGNKKKRPKGIVETTRVHVSALGPDGVYGPVAGVEVLLEAQVRRVGPGNSAEVVRRAISHSDNAGMVSHTWTLPAGSEVKARAERDGHVFYGEKGQEAHFISLYPVKEKEDAFEVEPRAIISVREGVLWVQGEWMIEHDERFGVSAGENGLALPLIAPILNGRSLQGEWMPAQAQRHMKLTVDGDKTAAHLRQGALKLFGVVGPGEIARVKFEYPIDIYDDSLALGIQSTSVPMKRVMVAVNAPDQLLPGLRLDGSPVRGMLEERRGEKTHLQWTVGDLVPGQLVTIQLSRLPHEGDFSRTIAGWIVVGISFLFLLGLLRVLYTRRHGSRSLATVKP